MNAIQCETQPGMFIDVSPTGLAVVHTQGKCHSSLGPFIMASGCNMSIYVCIYD